LRLSVYLARAIPVRRSLLTPTGSACSTPSAQVIPTCHLLRLVTTPWIGPGRAEDFQSRVHVVKRAQGGSDFDLDRLVALCPPCHAQTDAPDARGRLVVTPLGDGRFTVEVTRAADKWAIRA